MLIHLFRQLGTIERIVCEPTAIRIRTIQINYIDDMFLVSPPPHRELFSSKFFHLLLPRHDVAFPSSTGNAVALAPLAFTVFGNVHTLFQASVFSHIDF